MSRILLVDDDISFRKMLRLTLARMNHTVQEARDGNEALELLAEAPVDLMITDLIMPDKEGIETISLVRQRYPEIRIIAMSGGGRGSASDYLAIARAMGAQRVLAKPFSNDDLRTAIAGALEIAPDSPGTENAHPSASAAEPPARRSAIIRPNQSTLC